MLRACVIDYQGSWPQFLPMAEFAYNNSYQASIQMAPFEALYGRKCRSPLHWSEVGERLVLGPDVLQEAEAKVRLARELSTLALVNSRYLLGDPLLGTSATASISAKTVYCLASIAVTARAAGIQSEALLPTASMATWHSVTERRANSVLRGCILLERSNPPSFGGITPDLRIGSMIQVGGRTRYGVLSRTWWSVLVFSSGFTRLVNYILVKLC
uniref:Integrase catalytic domain-containing protein n=1 Tax=Ananas comosus var. bracteatus TaxID=296719 RepID=A0A6V7NWD6_ANACO|nr:unnamed protein product [Ananas comosus var. bracteatus]